MVVACPLRVSVAGRTCLPATAAAGSAGTLDGERSAVGVFLEIHLRAVQVAKADGIDDDLDAVLVENLVLVVRLVEGRRTELKPLMTDVLQPGDTIVVGERFF